VRELEGAVNRLYFYFINFNNDNEDHISLKIAYEAFKESGLVSVTIPENVVEIDGVAFGSCYSLEYIDYRAKNAVSSSGGYIFDTDDGTYLNIGYEVESLPEGAFAENVWGEVNFEVNPGTGECALTEISAGCFEFCNSEGDPLDITLPYGLESVGMNAFYDTYLGDVVLPLTITSLQDNAFYTEYLKYIVLPESLQDFGNDVFYSGALNAIM